MNKIKYLAIKPQSGIGNRLRTLLSYKVLADHLNLPLLVYWGDSHGCSGSLRDLINTPEKSLNIKLIEELEFNKLRLDSFCLDVHIDNIHKKDHDSNRTSSTTYTNESKNKLPLSHEELVRSVLKGIFNRLSVISNIYMPWSFFLNLIKEYIPDYEERYLKLVSSLKPSNPYLTSCNLALEDFSDFTYGIHVRRNDAVDISNPNKNEYEKSSLERYFSIIKSILDNNESANFYVSTDCQDSLRLFKDKFGDKILSINKKFTSTGINEIKGEQESAFQEAYLLSKTKLIFGNHYSTFCLLASEIGKNKLLYVVEDGFLDKENNLITCDFLPKKEGTSLISCCMNRNRNLSISLNTWLNIKGLNEIVIVDWSSSEEVIDLIPKDTKGKTVKVIRVEHQDRWVLSWAFNLAASKVSYDKILKLDADILAQKDLLDSNPLTPNSFFHGSWKAAKDENEKHLNGQMYCFAKDFNLINGYHEGITSYGWDDDDLYDRLKDIGVNEKIFSTEKIYHIPTCESERSKHQKEFVETDPKKLKDILFDEIMKNRIFAEAYPWLPESKKKKWISTDVADGYTKASLL